MSRSRLQELFLDAHELSSPEERRAFLDEHCAGKPVLRMEVEALLEAANLADVFFGEENGATGTGWARPAMATPGEPEAGTGKEADSMENHGHIGRYRLLRQIGEGGFGIVWLAEQEQPVRRTVALKIIKAGMDTREVVARFEQERQALAMMDHPNIAQVYEAGSTETGRPYFVMELVKGVPVTQFCDEHRLTVEERLALFREACLAIQHAHQKGIIHRDIKPSNILTAMVDDRPVLKVIDFGIAKATQQPLTDKTLHTRMEQFMGTPDYMSPEQASGGALDIDTRSDIYALGVLLYELLTGNPPFNRGALLKAGEQEIRRMICEVEPPKPSTRLGSLTAEEAARLAQSRQLEPPRLRQLVRGDLDWIVMRALEKDRSRRYDSANGLAEDIQLFLSHKPVSASPPGTVYVLRKFARRHRLALGAAAAVMAALVTGLAVSTWMFFEQKKAAKEAREANTIATRRLAESEAARREARTLTTFLLDLMKSPYPADQGRPITMRSILEKAEQQLPEIFKDRPDDRAIMEEAIAMSYDTIGSSGMGVKLLFKASNYVRLHPDYGAEHERTRRLQAQLALLYSHAGDHFNSRILMEAALKWERRLDPQSAMAIQREIDLAECYFAANSFEEAKALLLKARPLFGKVLGETSPEALRGLTLLCKTHLRLGQNQEALEAGGKALEFAPNDIAAADKGLIQNLVDVQIAVGDLEKAENLAERLWELRRLNGENNFYTLLAALDQARVYELQERPDDAILKWQTALADPVVGPAYNGLNYKLGEALFKQDRYQEALVAFHSVTEGAVPHEQMVELARKVKICGERLEKTSRDHASGEPSLPGSPNETK